MHVSNTVSALVELSLLIWLYLLLGRNGFWRARPQLEHERPPAPRVWPAVIAVVPARNEAETVETALRSLLGQHYPGRFTIILVDDHSQDGTRLSDWRSGRPGGSRCSQRRPCQGDGRASSGQWRTGSIMPKSWRPGRPTFC
jgi:Glycosyl transferase family 2